MAKYEDRNHENYSAKVMDSAGPAIGYRLSAIFTYVAEGGFPGPVSLGECSVGWLEMEVQEWSLARVERSAKLLVILPQILSSRALLSSRLDLSWVAMFFPELLFTCL